MRLFTVRICWSLMCLCVVILFINLILKNCHRSAAVDFITLVIGAFSLFKGVFNLAFGVISESLLFKFYPVAVHNIHPFFDWT